MTIFAQVGSLTANTNNLVYTTVSSGTYNVLAWNSNSTGSIQVKIGIVPNGSSVSTASWIDGPMLDALQPLERGGIPLGVGDLIYVNPSSAGIAVSVVGVVPT